MKTKVSYVLTQNEKRKKIGLDINQIGVTCSMFKHKWNFFTLECMTDVFEKMTVSFNHKIGAWLVQKVTYL